jgi:3-oxoadipyl-CoA thiolase
MTWPLPIKALIERNPSVDWNAVDEVFLGCANQAGEDNRNVARMALLLACRRAIPGVTLNRLCASGMDAIGTRVPRHRQRRNGAGDCRRRRVDVPRAVRDGQGRRGVLAQHEAGRHHHRLALHQPVDESQYGVDAMPQTADNVADD